MSGPGYIQEMVIINLLKMRTIFCETFNTNKFNSQLGGDIYFLPVQHNYGLDLQ